MNPYYVNDKLRCCPSFDQWQTATQLFIARNAAVDRLNMNKLAEQLARELNTCAYQHGPKGRLP